MEIKINELEDPRIIAFLEEHLSDMKSVSPPESKHALDIAGLQQPDITFWSFWEDSKLLACGALKELDSVHGEIKSMRASALRRRAGVGSFVLNHILSEAKNRGYKRLSLETGSMPFFAPARKLYTKHGFCKCEPFGTYKHDPNSVFMSIQL